MVRTAGVKGSDWAVSIGGFRDASIDDIDDFLERMGEAVAPASFQVFDADRVAGWEHLFFAVVNAVKAHEAGTAISRSLAIEVLLYVSCQDQISRALDLVGVTPSTERVALLVLADGKKEAAEKTFGHASMALGRDDDSVLGLDAEKCMRIKETFGVSDSEIEAVGGSELDALTRLLVERGALLPLRR
jgi:tRNA threonylcarbamoyladenosine modification (KEOPS) complex Cgi121 subunit